MVDVTWEAPGPGRWELDRSHMAGGTTPIMQALQEHSMPRGMRRIFRDLGTPADTLDARFVNGFMYTRLRPLIRPELLWFAEVRGEPVAFTLWLPDANQALRAARGRLTTLSVPVGLLRIARAARRVDRTRTIVTGIKEAHRSRGLGAALITEAQRAAFRLGYTES